MVWYSGFAAHCLDLILPLLLSWSSRAGDDALNTNVTPRNDVVGWDVHGQKTRNKEQLFFLIHMDPKCRCTCFYLYPFFAIPRHMRRRKKKKQSPRVSSC
jgi:hypothetical protein